MGKATHIALRIIIVRGLVGSLAVQALILPAVFRDFDGARPDVLALRWPVVLLLGGVILAAQVCAVCVWMLLGMVQRSTVFSPAAFRWVHIIVGCFIAASALCYALAAVMAPGEAFPPGIVLVVGGLGSVFLGIALIVLVMRALLRQAIASKAELEEVI